MYKLTINLPTFKSVAMSLYDIIHFLVWFGEIQESLSDTWAPHLLVHMIST